MQRSLVRRIGLSLAVASAIGSPRVALADPNNPTDEEKASARLFGTEGVQLAMSGDCRGAVEKLRRAEALVHAPTTAVPLAHCQIQLGRIVNGTEILNRVINEPLSPNAPQPWVDAKQRARALLYAATPRIGRLRVHVDRPPGAPEGLQVTVDGAPLPAVLLDNDRPTDPGVHRVSARQEGFTAAEMDVSLAEGQSQTVSLRLDVLPVEPAGSPAPWPAQATLGAPAPAAAADTQPHSANHLPAYLAFGAGAAGVAVGAVFGILALSTKSTLDSSCPSGKQYCPDSSSSDIDALHTDAILSTVGWGIAAAGAAAGAILLLTERPAEPTKAARLELWPWLGPGSAGLSGSFQ